ncbi:stage III sporulation protein AG [Clostridium grantii]|uniref:Stage III sporulation protein AG n=1 Tax=Clostridium grantii DSM 8605 TaxID=1121316 RepID=A0A1M5SFG4_9CLOT|nr:stage III sporulation protein AG [Clostridium grantii]SHH37195.1 stage III sporulation protein AG [Clostridium grantii DSM 8605]
MNIKEFLNKDEIKKVKKDKKNWVNLVILTLVAILMIVLSSSFSESKDMFSQKQADIPKESTISSEVEVNEYQTDMESKLKTMLEQIDGVGKVKVMINFEGGEEQVPATNNNDSTSLTEENDSNGGTRKITQNNEGETVVMVDGINGNQPLILKKNSPEVCGIFVVAEGASNDLIRLSIQKAVITLFGVPESKVTVYPMKK